MTCWSDRVPSITALLFQTWKVIFSFKSVSFLAFQYTRLFINKCNWQLGIRLWFDSFTFLFFAFLIAFNVDANSYRDLVSPGRDGLEQGLDDREETENSLDWKLWYAKFLSFVYIVECLCGHKSVFSRLAFFCLYFLKHFEEIVDFIFDCALKFKKYCCYEVFHVHRRYRCCWIMRGCLWTLRKRMEGMFVVLFLPP